MTDPNRLSKSEKLLEKSKNFLENFDLDFEHLKEELTGIKDVIFDCLAINADVKISFDESKLFGKSGSFSGSNISFNSSRIETLFSLRIDDLDKNNLTMLETFYANFPLKTTHSEHEQNLYDFMKKYQKNGFERYFSSVGSYRTVKYELLDTVFHECEHVRQDDHLNFLTTQCFPKDVESQILLFVVLFNTMFVQLHKENIYVEYERGDNLTFPIEFDAIFASFEVLQALKNTYFKSDKIFGEYLKKRVVFPENFSPRETATQMFKEYETIYEAYAIVFGDKFSTLNTSIHDHKPIIIGEIARRYDKMLTSNRNSTNGGSFHMVGN